MPGKWDGKSRITTKTYKDNYDRIFGKKVVQEEEFKQREEEERQALEEYARKAREEDEQKVEKRKRKK